MATAVSPIKVDAQTDELISHAAHFLGRSKKDFVDEAVRAYVDAHRDEINAGIRGSPQPPRWQQRQRRVRDDWPQPRRAR